MSSFRSSIVAAPARAWHRIRRSGRRGGTRARHRALGWRRRLRALAGAPALLALVAWLVAPSPLRAAPPVGAARWADAARATVVGRAAAARSAHAARATVAGRAAAARQEDASGRRSMRR
jgi:hypothetical protein